MSIARILASPTLKLGVIGFLVLLMLIPMALVDGLRAEREQRRDAVAAEIAASVGGAQTLLAPVVRVPFVEPIRDAKGVVVGETDSAWLFAPRRVKIAGALALEQRARGIFSVPVYVATHDIEGGFSFDEAAVRAIPGTPDLARAELLVPVSAARALRRIELAVDGTARELATGTHQLAGYGAFSTPLPGFRFDAPLPFRLTLAANGAEAIEFVPLAGDTEVRLDAPWPHPAFHGGFLPATRQIGDAGFAADWQVLSFNREIPAYWLASSDLERVFSANQFGVRLVQPVDIYFLNHRSAKYGFLFLVLTFGAFFLFETIGRSRMHAIQYLLVGAALAVFYLVLLATSEHLGFALSYLLAAGSMGLMIAAYAWAVMQSLKRALVIGSWLATLYGALYVMINLEDVALLVGAALTALVLALAMYLTRRVDWSVAGEPDPAPAAPASPNPLPQS